MNELLQDKREFYRRPEVSAAYDDQRFGGASGARVNQRELDMVLSMLPTTNPVLDLACGTGRLTRALQDRGQAVIGLDASPAMCQRAAAAGATVVIGDSFQAPFAESMFAGVVSLRFAFHFAELEPLLREMRRVVEPGGTLVFDTYSWSPRAAFAFGRSSWGGRVHLHSRNEVAALATHLSLRVDEVRSCFLFSPYLYRLAPLPLERLFEALEPRVPRSWLCRVFWKLTRLDERT